MEVADEFVGRRKRQRHVQRLELLTKIDAASITYLAAYLPSDVCVAFGEFIEVWGSQLERNAYDHNLVERHLGRVMALLARAADADDEEELLIVKRAADLVRQLQDDFARWHDLLGFNDCAATSARRS